MMTMERASWFRDDVRPGDFRVVVCGKHCGERVRVYNTYGEKALVELNPTSSSLNHGPHVMVRISSLSSEVERGDLDLRTAYEEGVRAEHEGRACRVPLTQLNASWLTQAIMRISIEYDRPEG